MRKKLNADKDALKIIKEDEHSGKLKRKLSLKRIWGKGSCEYFYLPRTRDENIGEEKFLEKNSKKIQQRNFKDL